MAVTGPKEAAPKPPTKMCPVGKASTVFALIPPSSTGDGAKLHAWPFQCSMRAGAPPAVLAQTKHPSAQTSLGEMALMLFRTEIAPVFGLGTIFQAKPS